MRKQITIAILLVVLIAAAWLVITLRRVANDQLDASNRGHAYRNFFGVLEMYTAQTNEFPTSLDDMLIIQDEIGYEGVRWPQDAQLLADLIQPDFTITPDPHNLSDFAPNYMTNAAWAAPDCEFYWQQVIEHLDTES
ncbi:MAG: hypothetical protein KDA29_06735 [Phycisphaerales bacterium]|nr:hypothetical protein [Phycisphaerales bacterium]